MAVIDRFRGAQAARQAERAHDDHDGDGDTRNSIGDLFRNLREETNPVIDDKSRRDMSDAAEDPGPDEFVIPVGRSTLGESPYRPLESPTHHKIHDGRRQQHDPEIGRTDEPIAQPQPF